MKNINDFTLIKKYDSFELYEGVEQKRLRKIILKRETLDKFFDSVELYDIFDLENTVMKRFHISAILDDYFGGDLKNSLNRILKSRETGAVILSMDNNTGITTDLLVKLLTAVNYLFGSPNLDLLSDTYYARFDVKVSPDMSDSLLGKFNKRLTLHNDGTFVNQQTDYLTMTKMDELNSSGGESLLLHLDDWEDLEAFSNHSIAHEKMIFSAQHQKSKNVNENVSHAIFAKDSLGKPIMSYIEEYIMPANHYQAAYLMNLSNSLENSSATIKFKLSIGDSIIANNTFWLHGRDRFYNVENGFRRELMRLRGKFI
ncbi:UNVERIFIED_CONTAM: hypothetical protein GTU68_041306 [Idotea baltica]|nr:hypothetical protein [Idotea baltica]